MIGQDTMGAGMEPRALAGLRRPLGPLLARARARHPVLRFLIVRCVAGIVTLLAVSVLIFLFTNVLPGNVATAVLGRRGSPQLVALLDQKLGLDRSVVSRYLSWLGGFVHGDMGQSAVALAQGAARAPVSGIIGAPLLNSFVLAAGTIVFLVPVSLLLGTVAAVRAGGRLDYGVSYSSLVLGGLPEFVLGTFLILIFFLWLHLLPPVALVPPGTSPLSHPNALVLPIVTLLGVSVAFSARQVQAGVIEALRQDYVKLARLGGIRERRVLWRYALRNALAPSIQAFAQTIQYLLGGIIIVEALFAYPGIGSLFDQSVELRDVPEVQAIAMVLAAIYIVVNICADLLVVLIVPKLRTGLE